MGEKKINIVIAFYGMLLIALGVVLLSQAGNLYVGRTNANAERTTLIISTLFIVASGIGILLRKNIARLAAIYSVAFLTLANTAFALGAIITPSVTIVWKLFFISVLFVNYYFFFFFTRPKVKEQFKPIAILKMVNKKLKIVLFEALFLIWGLIGTIKALLNIDATRAFYSPEQVKLSLATWLIGAISFLFVIIRKDKYAKKISEKSNRYSLEESKFILDSMIITFCLLAAMNILTILYILKG